MQIKRQTTDLGEATRSRARDVNCEMSVASAVALTLVTKQTFLLSENPANALCRLNYM